MLDIENYLTDELKKLNCSDIQITQLLQFLHPLFVKPKVIDKKKIADWLVEKNISFKSNPCAWLKVAMSQELENGTFEKEERHCCIHPFLEVLEHNGIKVLDNSCGYISTMFDYLINHDVITQEELVELNHQAINFLRGKGATTNDFINLWKRSKLCRDRKVDWKEIDMIASELSKSHIKLLEALENHDED